MVQIVSRSSWGATAPVGPAMVLPARELWLHHSVTPVTNDPRADMRAIERVGVERFGRFSYSWAVHPLGVVLEGAGTTIGAHTGGRNSTSFGLVLIGNYDELSITDPQMTAAAGLIRSLIATGKLRPGDYPTGGHRDLKSTACPGARAYPRIGELRRLAANPQEDDMPLTTDDLDKIQTAVRQVLNEGTGKGLRSWAETSAATLATTQAGINLLNAVRGDVGGLDDVDEAAVAAALLPALVAAMPVQDIVEGVLAGLPDDQVQGLLDALAVRPAS